LNNGINNLDEYLKNVLDTYHAEPSSHVWGKMNSKLLKKDMSEFARLKKLRQSFKPGHTNIAMQVKIWASYAAAAVLAVGFVYGSTYVISTIVNKTPTNPEKNIVVPVNPKNQLNELKDNKDNSTTADISVLPLNNRKDKSRSVKQKDTIITNSNNSESNISGYTASTNSTKIENNTTASSGNVNSLINYIQRLNPTNETAAIVKNEERPDDIQAIISDNTPATRDTVERPNDDLEYKIEIPNVITPNGDGFNDVLVIKNLEKFVDNSLTIADRTGKVVFEKNSYQNDWGAQNLPDGTYYYILTYKQKNNNRGVIKGMITVIRR